MTSTLQLPATKQALHAARKNYKHLAARCLGSTEILLPDDAQGLRCVGNLMKKSVQNLREGWARLDSLETNSDQNQAHYARKQRVIREVRASFNEVNRRLNALNVQELTSLNYIRQDPEDGNFSTDSTPLIPILHPAPVIPPVFTPSPHISPVHTEIKPILSPVHIADAPIIHPASDAPVSSPVQSSIAPVIHPAPDPPVIPLVHPVNTPIISPVHIADTPVTPPVYTPTVVDDVLEEEQFFRPHSSSTPYQYNKVVSDLPSYPFLFIIKPQLHYEPYRTLLRIFKEFVLSRQACFNCLGDGPLLPVCDSGRKCRAPEYETPHGTSMFHRLHQPLPMRPLLAASITIPIIDVHAPSPVRSAAAI